jgi:polysaccharide pyruvyl transferase WcaK-like protein
LLEQVGVSANIQVTADPALLLEPEPLDEEEVLRAEGLAGMKHIVGVSVREPGVAAPDLEDHRYHALLANAADYMVDRQDAFLVFVPMERLDMKHSHAVIAEMARADRATVLKGGYSSAQMLALMKRFDFAVGMRLHFLIFAAIQGVPFVALPYASKVGGFLEDLGVAMPPMKQVNAGQLIAYIDRNWDLRRTLQQAMLKTLPLLKERALTTNRLAVQLVTERAGDRVISKEVAL